MALFNTLKTILTPYAEKINKHTTDISILSEGIESVHADLNEAVDELNASLGDGISTDSQNVKKQIEVSPNLIIADNCIWGEYITPTGIVSNAGASYGHTGAIFVAKGVTYKFKTNGAYGVYRTAYRIVTNTGTYANGGSLGTIDSDGFVLFTPDFSGFITVNVIKNASQMFCEQTQYPDAYIDGISINTKLGNLNNDVQTIEASVLNNTPVIAQKIIEGACYVSDGGMISTLSSTSPQRLCAVKVIKGIAYNIITHKASNATETLYAFFIKDTIPQPGDRSYDNTRHTSVGENIEVVAPITGWVVFSTVSGFDDETVTPVTASDLIARNTKNDNPLFGKYIAVDGDSICYGNGYIGGYAKIIADNNSMSYQNIAVGGATIVSGTQSNGTNRHWICRSVQNISENADYVIIEGGINDSSMSSVAVGELTQGYTATLNDETFYGALEEIFKTLATKYVGKKYGFIIPHGILYPFMKGGAFYQAVYDCAEKWGIPVLDLTKFAPPFNQFRHDETLDAIRNTYTTAGDGWHPTELCYREYYVPVIESWMKTL